jgi:N-acetylglucosamine malate deacetylase 1
MIKLDILAIAIHPDDLELSASGTLMVEVANKKKVGILDLTHGELGSRGTPQLRLQEAQKAAEIMGIHVREFLNFRDGFFAYDETNLLEIVKRIRKYQPEIVLANAVSDRHPDHGRAAKLIADACFYAGLVKIETTLEGSTQGPWRPKALYHYIQDHALEPDFVVDVSSVIDRKMQSILAYSSQFFDPKNPHNNTPISSPEFLESVKAKMRVHGRPCGFEFGEGFTKSRYIGVKSVFDLQ